MSDRPSWPARFVAGQGDREALLILASLRGLTAGRLLALADGRRSARWCLDAVVAGRAGSDADTRAARESNPSQLQEALDACGARMVAVGDPDYPPLLMASSDPPGAIFVRGRNLDPAELCIAVVGARDCSALGRELAEDLASHLARSGVAVVSGAARGIDSAGHEGALAAGGRTIAVLGSGIDVAYPRRNARMLERILDEGSIVSEYPPGIPAEPFRFPARNRIIAGMSRAVVIVEGGDGSGSLITAEFALQLGRDIYAVPGAINNPLAAAPLSIIRDGAVMIRSAEDLIFDLKLDRDVVSDGVRSGLTLAELAILDSLEGPTLAEALATKLGCDLSGVVSILLALEMRGLVRGQGGRFEPTLAATKVRR